MLSNYDSWFIVMEKKAKLSGYDWRSELENHNV